MTRRSANARVETADARRAAACARDLCRLRDSFTPEDFERRIANHVARAIRQARQSERRRSRRRP